MSLSFHYSSVLSVIIVNISACVLLQILSRHNVLFWKLHLDALCSSSHKSKKNKHNVSESTTSGRHDAPHLKLSRWDLQRRTQQVTQTCPVCFTCFVLELPQQIVRSYIMYTISSTLHPAAAQFSLKVSLTPPLQLSEQQVHNKQKNNTLCIYIPDYLLVRRGEMEWLFPVFVLSYELTDCCDKFHMYSSHIRAISILSANFPRDCRKSYSPKCANKSTMFLFISYEV